MSKHTSNRSSAVSYPLFQTSFNQENRLQLLKIWGENEIDRIEAYPFHFSVYWKDEKEMIPLIKLSGFNSYEQEDFLMFETLIKIVKDQPLRNLIFLCTVFHRPAYLQILKNPKSWIGATPDLNAEFLLEATTGFLTYSFQLEQYYQMLTGKNQATAIAFRRDWNVKRATARREAESISVKDTMSLADFIRIKNPDPDGFVYQPAFYEGFRLYKLLQTIKSSVFT